MSCSPSACSKILFAHVRRVKGEVGDWRTVSRASSRPAGARRSSIQMGGL
jgi:hypothetical protein